MLLILSNGVDIISNFTAPTCSHHLMVLHEKAPIDYHAMTSKNKVKDSSFLAALVSTRTDDFELTCFSKATKHHQWHATVTEEISALFRNDAWTLVPHCPQMNIVGWKWVFHISTKLMVL